MTVREVLKATPLFAALNDAELDALAARAGLRSHPTGTLLFQEGQPCAGLFIVVTGTRPHLQTLSNGQGTGAGG